MPLPARSSSLKQDAASLYDAATAFIRVYQFRDRDHALRYGLTVVQAYALDILLSAGGHSLTGLALALRLDKSTVSRVVSGMTAHGLVEWSRPVHDQRAKLIVASADGRRRYQRLRRAIERDNARLLASYSPESRQAVISILRQLVHRADGVVRASSTPAGPARRTQRSQPRGT
jgi:DNA-binding MarR family transcriptional regulator